MGLVLQEEEICQLTGDAINKSLLLGRLERGLRTEGLFFMFSKDGFTDCTNIIVNK